MRAAEWGWLDVLLALLQEQRVVVDAVDLWRESAEQRAVVDAVDLWGESAVLKAARQGRKSLVEALVKAGADVALRDESENTLLSWAVRNGWTDLVSSVLALSGQSVYRNRWTDLVWSILALSGQSVSARDLDAALGAAARRGSGIPALEMVILLLKRGAAPDSPDAFGHTPLMRAAAAGSLPVVRALLKAGAGVFGHTPLMRTAAAGSLPVVSALLKAGAAEHDPGHRTIRLLLSQREVLGNEVLNGQDVLGWTALHQAAARGNLPVLKLLLGKGAVADRPDAQGFTCLRRAAYEGHRDIVRTLVLRKPARQVRHILEEMGVASLQDLSPERVRGQEQPALRTDSPDSANLGDVARKIIVAAFRMGAAPFIGAARSFTPKGPRRRMSESEGSEGAENEPIGGGALLGPSKIALQGRAAGRGVPKESPLDKESEVTRRERERAWGGGVWGSRLWGMDVLPSGWHGWQRVGGSRGWERLRRAWEGRNKTTACELSGKGKPGHCDAGKVGKADGAEVDMMETAVGKADGAEVDMMETAVGTKMPGATRCTLEKMLVAWLPLRRSFQCRLLDVLVLQGSSRQ
ncbi:ankyrin repeat-containing domain protein [Baffinella frigidus]|nr:ankyrin repeat-containing domain protein [Cryptophyta sp. CCMP2293]